MIKIYHNNPSDKEIELHNIVWKFVDTDGIPDINVGFKSLVYAFKAMRFIDDVQPVEGSNWYGFKISEMIDWCEENCCGNYGFTTYNFWYLTSHEDYVAFTLRWSQ